MNYMKWKKYQNSNFKRLNCWWRHTMFWCNFFSVKNFIFTTLDDVDLTSNYKKYNLITYTEHLYNLLFLFTSLITFIFITTHIIFFEFPLYTSSNFSKKYRPLLHPLSIKLCSLLALFTIFICQGSPSCWCTPTTPCRASRQKLSWSSTMISTMTSLR